MLMKTKKAIHNELKKRNIVFYDSKFGRENITGEVPSFDFIESRFGVKLNPSSLVIDLGCGIAGCLLSLNCNEKIGLDISHINLIIARAQNSKLMLVQADAEQVPFREQVFDAVLIVDLLHHVPKPSAVIKEVSRILRKDGQLFIWDACVDGVKPIYPVAMFVQKISEKMDNIEHFGPSLRQVNRWLKQNDFRVMKKFGEGSFIGYMGSILESFLKRIKISPSHHARRTLITMDNKFETSIFKNFPLKFGIMATQGSVFTVYEEAVCAHSVDEVF